MKKRINSRAKGARIEREAARFLTSLGFPCERAARNGVDGGEDLMLPDSLSHAVHIEVKGDESIDIGTRALADAMHQAFEACKGTQRPAVLWHRKRKGWRFSWYDMGVIVTVAGVQDINAVIDEIARRTEG